MASRKYSRQREAIKHHLKARGDHPTAEQVYESVRQTLPNISLGTVYRNLALLEKDGEIVKVSNGAGRDRYDGNLIPHYHFSCCSCGQVTDVFLEVDDTMNQRAAKATGGKVLSQSVIFYGICKACMKAEKM
jgi:Fur family peroxide stress response transcriptional regulator